MFTAIFEAFSSVFVMGFSFFFIFILPLFIIVCTIIICVRRKKENKSIKRHVLFSCVIELILIVFIFVLYRNIEDSDFLLLVIFLCGGFSLLIALLIALPIICIYQKYKKVKKIPQTTFLSDKEEHK